MHFEKLKHWLCGCYTTLLCFFKYPHRPSMATLAQPMACVWDRTILLISGRCSESSSKLFERVSIFVIWQHLQTYYPQLLCVFHLIFFCLLAVKNVFPKLLKATNSFFCALLYCLIISFPKVCHCQQYGGNSLSGHDGNSTRTSQVSEWLLLEKKEIALCFLFVFPPSRTAIQRRCHLW